MSGADLDLLVDHYLTVQASPNVSNACNEPMVSDYLARRQLYGAEQRSSGSFDRRSVQATTRTLGKGTGGAAAGSGPSEGVEVDLASGNVEDIVDQLLGKANLPGAALRGDDHSSPSYSATSPVGHGIFRPQRDRIASPNPNPLHNGALREHHGPDSLSTADEKTQEEGGPSFRDGSRGDGHPGVATGFSSPTQRHRHRPAQDGGSHSPAQQLALTEDPFLVYTYDPLLRRMKIWQERRDARRVQAIYDSLVREQKECPFRPRLDMQSLVFAERDSNAGVNRPLPERQWAQLAQSSSATGPESGGGGGEAWVESKSESGPLSSVESTLLAPSSLYENNVAWGYDSFVSRIAAAREAKERRAQEEEEEVRRRYDLSTWNPRPTVPKPFELGKRRKKAFIPSLRNNDTFATLGPIVREVFGNPVSKIEPPSLPGGLFSTQASTTIIRATNRTHAPLESDDLHFTPLQSRGVDVWNTAERSSHGASPSGKRSGNVPHAVSSVDMTDPALAHYIAKAERYYAAQTAAAADALLRGGCAIPDTNVSRSAEAKEDEEPHDVFCYNFDTPQSGLTDSHTLREMHSALGIDVTDIVDMDVEDF